MGVLLMRRSLILIASVMFFTFMVAALAEIQSLPPQAQLVPMIRLSVTCMWFNPRNEYREEATCAWIKLNQIDSEGRIIPGTEISTGTQTGQAVFNLRSGLNWKITAYKAIYRDGHYSYSTSFTGTRTLNGLHYNYPAEIFVGDSTTSRFANAKNSVEDAKYNLVHDITTKH